MDRRGISSNLMLNYLLTQATLLHTPSIFLHHQTPGMLRNLKGRVLLYGRRRAGESPNELGAPIKNLGMVSAPVRYRWSHRLPLVFAFWSFHSSHKAVDFRRVVSRKPLHAFAGGGLLSYFSSSRCSRNCVWGALDFEVTCLLQFSSDFRSLWCKW